MKTQLRKAFSDPQARRAQIILSKEREMQFEHLANTTIGYWREVWLELASLHHEVIELLETIDQEGKDSES